MIELENESNSFESRRREQEERAPLDTRLHNAYLLLLEGAFHVTRLTKFSEKLETEKNESAVEVDRSSLVIAGACMDATLKQLIRDNLLDISLLDERAQESLSKRVGRILKKDIAHNAQELANLLIWREIRISDFLERIIDELVSHSLQSVDQLCQVHSMFNIKFNASVTLSKALEARNQIVHEMDVVLPFQLKFDDSGNIMIGESRRKRTREDLYTWADELLETAHKLIREVDYKYELASKTHKDG